MIKNYDLKSITFSRIPTTLHDNLTICNISPGTRCTVIGSSISSIKFWEIGSVAAVLQRRVCAVIVKPKYSNNYLKWSVFLSPALDSHALLVQSAASYTSCVSRFEKVKITSISPPESVKI